jgi:hypothetical protein
MSELLVKVVNRMDNYAYVYIYVCVCVYVLAIMMTTWPHKSDEFPVLVMILAQGR